MIRHLPAALLLVATIALAEDGMLIIEPPPPDIVEANRVELGPLERFVERSYKFITPGQPVPNYPAYAYPMAEVLSSRSCDSFKDAPTKSEIAFVSALDQPEAASDYIGIRAANAAALSELCSAIKESPPALAEHLDSLMFEAEADPNLLKGTKYRVTEAPMRNVAMFRQDCVRPFMTATTDTTPFLEISDASTLYNALHQDVGWEVIKATSAIASDLYIEFIRQRKNTEIWKIEPRDQKRLAGRVFITSTPVPAPVSTMLALHDTPGANKLTAWYQSPFCKTGPHTWYLTSKYPLKKLKPDFRSKVTTGYVSQADHSP